MSSIEAPPSPSNDPKGENYKKWITSPTTARWAREWNRTYLLACAAGLLVDPLFLYSLSISGPMMCLFTDGWFTIAVTVLRSMVDCVHVCNIWVQLRTACGGVVEGRESSGVEQKCEKGLLKSLYVRSKNGLILDLFVILPIIQVKIYILVSFFNFIFLTLAP
jgi:cyclic nucleotide gated channel, plant